MTTVRRCTRCNGRGVVRVAIVRSFWRDEMIELPARCLACGGRGYIKEKKLR